MIIRSDFDGSIELVAPGGTTRGATRIITLPQVLNPIRFDWPIGLGGVYLAPSRTDCVIFVEYSGILDSVSFFIASIC